MYYIKAINKTKIDWRTTIRIKGDTAIYDILKFDTLQEVIRELEKIKIKVGYDGVICER